MVFRLLWGIFGTPNARFLNFIRGPAAVLKYLRSPRAEKAAPKGHSPVAGWAIIVILLCLSIQVGTGLYADDEIYTTGPLAGTVSSSISAEATRIHYLNSDILLALIAMHLVANLFYLLILKINLIAPMITGGGSTSERTQSKVRISPTLQLPWVVYSRVLAFTTGSSTSSYVCAVEIYVASTQQSCLKMCCLTGMDAAMRRKRTRFHLLFGAFAVAQVLPCKRLNPLNCAYTRWA